MHRRAASQETLLTLRRTAPHAERSPRPLFCGRAQFQKHRQVNWKIAKSDNMLAYAERPSLMRAIEASPAAPYVILFLKIILLCSTVLESEFAPYPATVRKSAINVCGPDCYLHGKLGHR
jgi:hypothetical protein